MAEYVTKEQAIHSITETELDMGGFADAKMRIDELPTADVVERSELYELNERIFELEENNEDLSHNLAQAFETIGKLDKLNADLRSKVDKAIEEITNLNRYQEGIDTMNVGDDLMISWCKTLDILKEI